MDEISRIGGKRTLYSDLINFSKAVWPHLLSHHPHCRAYDRDVLHIGGLRFCAGCFIAYPTAVAVIAYSLATGIFLMYVWYVFMVPGILLGMFQFLSLYGKAERFRHAIKFAMGVGIGLTTIGVFRLPVHICLSVYIFYMLVMLAGILASKRVIKMENICKRCPHSEDWENCPGLRKVHDELRKEGLM